MNQTDFQSPVWYNAIDLKERIASLLKTDLTQNKQVNVDLPQKLFKRWRNQAPFSNESYFDQRLAIDGLDEEKLLLLLGEPITAVHQRITETPDWLKQLSEAFSTNFEQFNFNLTEDLENNSFLYLIEPLIYQGLNRLSEGIEKLSQQYLELAFEAKTVKKIMLANLTVQLAQMLDRTLVLELNVARLEGMLIGDTAEERFQNFIERLRERDFALSILQEYPVLTRQAIICINHWLDFSLEFLQHLCADWREIQTKFSPENQLGLLVELKGGAGDSHKCGRSVLIAKFDSGLQLVYKPRSLAVDVHFQELLIWLNARGNHPSFGILKLIDRGDYGWVEFVQPQSCQTLAEIQRFYQRQGGYLALLYVLQATDFHSENLIAVGEHPILIDLEALFHPKVGNIDDKGANSVVSDKMAYSVLGIGLLPQRVWSNDESEGIDLSGLGAKAGQLTPSKLPYWEGMGTDEMRLSRKRMEIPPDQNQPKLNGESVNLVDYTKEILNGFTNIYQILLKYQQELLSQEGPIAAFAGDEVRVILGLTRIYSFLLDESFHPDLLRNALERDCHFDRLWLQIQHRPYLQEVIVAEREDLLRGDIPFFITRPNSLNVWGSSGQCLTNLIEETSIDMVYHRLRQMSDLDMSQQLWFIRASLATVYLGLYKAAFPTYSITQPQTITNKEQLLAAACKIGDHLDSLAVRGDKDASWIGMMLTNERYWSLESLGVDLYEGLPGIILFLAYLGAITQQESYTNLATAALITMRYQYEQSRPKIKSVGAFGGWGGIIYTLTHLGVLWNQPKLLTEAEEIVRYLPHLIEQDEELDIIGGVAGCIASLLGLYGCHPDESILNVAIQCGDRLITKAEKMPSGIGWRWKNKMFEEEPLTGFSHGVAGIAWTLLELASVTGEQRFKTIANSAIEYERSLFVPEVGNWLDLRNFTNTVLGDKNKTTCMNAWCHGAPGIGMARLRCLSHLDTVEIRNEIDTALKTTIAQGFGSNHSLCHGDLGNLELLLQASLMLDKSQWQPQLNHFSAIIFESINQYGWLCGVPSGVETPGLMTGLAGIGYQLLRLARPDSVPSILLLEPPNREQCLRLEIA